MARLSVLFFLSLTLSACTGKEEVTETASSVTIDRVAVTQVWHKGPVGPQLYRDAKEWENSEIEQVRKQVLRSYARLAFGEYGDAPSLPEAKVDFDRMWDAAVLKADSEFLADVVRDFHQSPVFLRYVEMYVSIETIKAKNEGFDYSEPYGGNEWKRRDGWTSWCPKGAYGEYAVMAAAGEMRKLLPVGHVRRKELTLRLAEVASSIECTDEGVPRNHPREAYEAYAELGMTAEARAMAQGALEREFCVYATNIDCDGIAAEPRIDWRTPEQWAEVKAWQVKAEASDAEVCAVARAREFISSAEENGDYVEALQYYELCGDETNAKRMRVLAGK